MNSVAKYMGEKKKKKTVTTTHIKLTSVLCPYILFTIAGRVLTF